MKTVSRFKICSIITACVVSVSYFALAPTVAMGVDIEQHAAESETLSEVLQADNRVTRFAAARKLNSSFSFSSSIMFQNNSFDKSNIGIELDAVCPVNGSFTVELIKGATVIGEATLRRNGHSTAEWTNVGPGSFAFRFNKSSDGKVIKCTNVRSYSW